MTDQLSPQQLARYNAKQKIDADINIFIGLCIGMLCDGHVNKHELDYLIRWIDEHPHVSKKYPISLVAKKIPEWMSDGVLDESEEIEMLAVLNTIANGSTDADGLYCHPEPDIIFEGKRFSFTGKFTHSRPDFEKFVILAGSTCHKNISRETDYVVIGETGSEGWKHPTGGNKIKDAVALRDKGYGIKIVREQHFADSLVALSQNPNL